ncbi:hypothetical protein AB0D97_29160 [Streptomyces roseus]|uniref:hypothetical protein n=1 Tax=Streptomyces roseus TaxID=66430 RepID=UPI0033E2F370
MLGRLYLGALGFAVPGHGLLLAYSLTQLAGSLGLTPGSPSIAEATMSALLVASGMPAQQTIAVALTMEEARRAERERR